LFVFVEFSQGIKKKLSEFEKYYPKNKI
jgi:hypothetical protein